MEDQTISVTLDTIVAEVTKAKEEGYRLVTMSCIDVDENCVDLLYHFDKELELKHLRVQVQKKAPVPSISGVYFAAFLIENEIIDHFGLSFDGLVLDFGGTLYLEGEDEVVRTPFCKYGVVRKDSEAAAETDAAKA